MSQLSVAGQGSMLLSAGRTLGIPGGVSVLVTRAPGEEGLLWCGDVMLRPQCPPACSAMPEGDGTIRPGQWFTDPVSGLEFVCTRAGYGSLTFSGRLVQRQVGPPGRAAGPLPRPEP